MTSRHDPVAKWIATRKFQAAGRSPPSGVDQGKVGMARPAKLWRMTAAIAELDEDQRAADEPGRPHPGCRPAPAGSIQPREQATAIAISVQAKACARQAWSMAKSRPRLVADRLDLDRGRGGPAGRRRPPGDDEAEGEVPQRRSHARASVRQIQAARITVRIVMSPALSRCECSANIAGWSASPWGLSEPLESGQSGNAIPAPMLVVKAPRVTRTKTHVAAIAANAARPGL
jgi:hypothetical protein